VVHLRLRLDWYRGLLAAMLGRFCGGLSCCSRVSGRFLCDQLQYWIGDCMVDMLNWEGEGNNTSLDPHQVVPLEGL
jgi:hypothetical protein